MSKKPSKALHVKKGTRGSSNEISFSVLDAAREESDKKTRESNESDRAGTGKIKLFTLDPGGRKHVTPAKDSEIILSGNVSKKRKNPSNNKGESKARIVVPAIVAASVALVFVVTTAQAFVQTNERNDRLRSELREQIDVVIASDETMVSFDTLVSQQCAADRFNDSTTNEERLSSSEILSSYEELKQETVTVKEELVQTINGIKSLQERLSDNADKEASHQALVAAQSRLNMVDSGENLLDDTVVAVEVSEQAQAGWTSIINADACIREATTLSKEMTTENISAALAKTDEATAYLSDASGFFQNAQTTCNGDIDFGDYTTYIEKRQQSQAAAYDTYQAYLERDKKALLQNNEQYNTLEDEAAQLSENIKDGPSALVRQYYEEKTEKERKTYESERTNAGNADTFLRDYLGTSSE